MQHNNNVVTGNNNVVTGNREGKIRAAHLLVKHRDSRRPVGRGNEEIVRSKETALGHLAEYERMIRSGEISLGDLAKEKSDCMSGKKHGDLYALIGSGDEVDRPY